MQRFTWTIRSEDRVSGDPWAPTFAVPKPLQQITGIKPLWFRGFNTLPNVDSTNNTLVVDTTLLGTLTYDIPLTNMGPVYGTNLVCGAGTVTSAESKATTLFENDLRYMLLRYWPTQLSTATLDPATGFLSLEWKAAVGLASYNILTTADWLHLDNNTTPSIVWIADDFLDLGGPSEIAITSSTLFLNQNADTGDFQSTIIFTIPVVEDFLSPIGYESVNPVKILTRSEEKNFSSFSLKFINPVTRLPVPQTRYAIAFELTSSHYQSL